MEFHDLGKHCSFEQCGQQGENELCHLRCLCLWNSQVRCNRCLISRVASCIQLPRFRSSVSS